MLLLYKSDKETVLSHGYCFHFMKTENKKYTERQYPYRILPVAVRIVFFRKIYGIREEES